MKLIESILTKNPCYTAGRKITVKGLMGIIPEKISICFGYQL